MREGRKSSRRKSSRRKSPRRKSGGKIRRSKRRLRGGVLKGVQHQLDQIWRQRVDADVPSSMTDHFALNMPIRVTDAAKNAIKSGNNAAAMIDDTYDTVREFYNNLKQFDEFSGLLYEFKMHDGDDLPNITEAYDKIMKDIELINVHIIKKCKAIRRITEMTNQCLWYYDINENGL